MTVRIGGLDLSATSTGVTLSDGSSRTIRPRAGAKDRGRRLNEIVSRLNGYLVADRPHVAIIEGPNLGAIPGRLAAVVLGEVRGAVKGRLFELGVPFVEVAPAALKQFATGHGNADKDLMVEAARQSGADVANHDEADSWMLWAMGRMRFSETWSPAYHAVELSELRERLLDGVRWPVLEVAS